MRFIQNYQQTNNHRFMFYNIKRFYDKECNIICGDKTHPVAYSWPCFPASLLAGLRDSGDGICDSRDQILENSVRQVP